jgi:hypothetical protein
MHAIQQIQQCMTTISYNGYERTKGTILQIKEKGAAAITEQNVYPVELTNCKSFC